MADNSIKDQIAKLVAIHKIDKEAYDIQVALKERPSEIQELQRIFDAQRGQLISLEEKHKASLLSRKKEELELQIKEDQIVKSNAQLSLLKTNKEYTAKMSEIESVKADKSRVEEVILLSYDVSEKLEVEIKKEKVEVAEKEKEFLANKKMIEDELARAKSRLVELEKQRQGMTDGIEALVKTRYEKLLVNKGGIAIVPIQGTVCGGCFMNLTPQMINSVTLGEEMVSCEICSRFLYSEEKN